MAILFNFDLTYIVSCHESKKAETNQISPLVPLELELLLRRFLYAAACVQTFLEKQPKVFQSLHLRRRSRRTARRMSRTARVPTTTPSRVCNPVELELVVLDPT